MITDNTFMKSFWILVLCSVSFCCVTAARVEAAALSIDPIIFDIDAEAREIIRKDITLTNKTDTKLIVFATVNEVAVGTSGEIKEFVTPVMTDGTQTITSWVEITRGRIELLPRATTTIPMTLKIHPNAKPGEYHVFIGFVPASKRFEAEAQAMAGDASGAIVKVSLTEKKDTLLRIRSFLVDRFIVSKQNRIVEVDVQNDGENPATPTGEVIFYNATGEEVTSVPINTDNHTIAPGEKKTLSATIPLERSFGRFKANVSLRYGESQTAAVFDTAQFFMVPLPYVFVAVCGIILFSLLITYLLHRSLARPEYGDEHEGKEVPLRVRNDRVHQQKEHDIDLKK
jgi:hypothetical protein